MNISPENWRDSYLTVAQAAEVVNMTPKALYNRISRGEGPQLARIGRTIRIYGVSLVEWIENSSPASQDNILPDQRKRNRDNGIDG